MSRKQNDDNDVHFSATPLVASCFVGLVVLWLVGRFRRRRAIAARGLRPLPGPSPWPLVGSAFDVARFPTPWAAFSALRGTYGDVFGIQLGSEHCVVVSGFDAIREVLVHKWADFAHRPDFVRFSAIFRGHRNRSVALCDWSEKQRRRRSVAYPYTHPRPSSDDPLDAAITRELERLVARGAPALSVDLHATLLRASANIFYRFFCGRPLDDDNNSSSSLLSRVASDYYAVFRLLFTSFPVDFFPWLRFVGGGGVVKQLHALSATISRVTRSIFQEHAASLDPDKPRDLVDTVLLLARGRKEEEESELDEEEALVLVEDLVGGHVALHNMCMWALGLVATRDHVQRRIAAEATAATTAGRSSSVSLADRSRLPYTEATVLEVLRIVVSPIIPHRATRDTAIRDYFVAKDSLILFNTFELHLDPSLWKEPQEFRPDRFLSVEGRVNKPDHFIPFSSGKRTCLGDHIARSALLLTLATLLRSFHVRLHPDSPPVPSLEDVPGTFLWPEHVRLVLEPRQED